MVRGSRDPGSEVGAGYRQILNLAVPAFLSLIAEPLFLVADSAVVGHLGTAELAGLGVASAALTTFTGLFVFLAYATTATSSRRMGAGDRQGAAQAGVDGLWLSVIIGPVSYTHLRAHETLELAARLRNRRDAICASLDLGCPRCSPPWRSQECCVGSKTLARP